MELYAEKRLVTKNTLCKKGDIHKLRWVHRGDEMWASLDYVLNDWHIKEKPLDVNVMRGSWWDV